MKFLKSLALILSASFVLTSCIEMKEKIVFNKKGGGTYTFTFNMSEMVDVINSLEENSDDPSMAMGAKGFAQEMAGGMDEFITKIKTVKDISNINEILNEEEYTFGYSFDFKNVEALNNVMLALSNDSIKTDYLFMYGKKGFTRTGNNSFTSQLNKEFESMTDQAPGMDMDDLTSLGDSDSTNAMPEGMEELAIMFKSLENMSLITEYTFPKKIKGTESEYEVVMDGKKTITQKMEFFKKENKEKKTQLVVEFK